MNQAADDKNRFDFNGGSLGAMTSTPEAVINWYQGPLAFRAKSTTRPEHFLVVLTRQEDEIQHHAVMPLTPEEAVAALMVPMTTQNDPNTTP